MSLGHVAELRAQAAYFQVRHVGLRQRRKWTWNDMDFPLNVANNIWGSIFLTQKLGDVTMATMGVPNFNQIWDHYNPHHYEQSGFLGGLIGYRGRMCMRHGG